MKLDSQHLGHTLIEVCSNYDHGLILSSPDPVYRWP